MKRQIFRRIHYRCCPIFLYITYCDYAELKKHRNFQHNGRSNYGSDANRYGLNKSQTLLKKLGVISLLVIKRRMSYKHFITYISSVKWIANSPIPITGYHYHHICCNHTNDSLKRMPKIWKSECVP